MLVSAALRQIEGREKQHFAVMVPLGTLLQPGIRVTIFTKDLWATAQKDENIVTSDKARLSGIEFAFTVCHAAGCTAEVEATPDLLTSLKSSGGLVVFTTSDLGAWVAFQVPLAGFAQALAGPPVARPPLARPPSKRRGASNAPGPSGAAVA